MVQVGRDGLGGTGSKLHLDSRLARHGDVQPAVEHHDPRPGACLEAMRSTQPGRHGQAIPVGARAAKTETFWWFGPVAKPAAEQGPEPGLPTRAIDHPGPELEWRAVTDMLAVAARQLRDPVAFAVFVEAEDRSFHRDQPMPASSSLSSGSSWEKGFSRASDRPQ